MRKLVFLLANLLLIAEAQVFGASGTQFYGVTIGRRHAQPSTNAPSLLPTQAYEGRAFIYSAVATVGAVRKPVGAAVNLTSAGDHIEVRNRYDSVGALNGGWPQGNYVITNINAVDGTKSSQMNLSSDFYPTPARVNNFVEAQAIRAPQPFTLTWDPLGRPATDFVYVRIEQDGALVFETSPIPGVAGALNGTATGVTIPANRLQEARVYTCSVTVWRAITRDNTTIPGAQGQTAYTAETILTIRTRWNLQDVRYYGVEKRVNYEQLGAAPVLRANPFEAVSFASATGVGALTAASLRTPAGLVKNMTGVEAEFSLAESFASQGAMDAAFGSGLYEIRMTTKNNGLRTNSNNLTGNTYPAQPPHVINIDEAQYIKANAAFTLSWNWQDGTAADHQQIVILDGTTVVLATPAALFPGSMNGAQRAIVIPSGLLAPGKTYQAMLRCCRISALDSFTYPTAVGQWGYARVTRFPLQTASGPSPRPILEIPRRLGNQTQLTFSSIRGERYTIQSTDALPAWNPTPTLTATGAVMTVLLPANALRASYYRVVVNP